MKSIILSFLLVPFFGASQVKMQGLGYLKIDSTTTDIINQISESADVKVKPAYDMMDTYMVDVFGKKTKKIFLLGKTDEKGKYGIAQTPDMKFIDHDSVKTYFIDYLEISTVPLRKLYLTFYMDTLYKIDCELDKELHEALEIKYGKPKVELKEKTITCRSGLGVEYSEVEKTFDYTWATNNSKIEVIGLLNSYFDSKCKKSYISIFSINALRQDKQVSKLLSLKKDQQSKSESETKKKQLSGF